MFEMDSDGIVTIEVNLDDPVEVEIFHLYEMAARSPFLRTALQKGLKCDVVFHINGGRVVDYGPFVRQVP